MKITIKEKINDHFFLSTQFNLPEVPPNFKASSNNNYWEKLPLLKICYR